MQKGGFDMQSIKSVVEHGDVSALKVLVDKQPTCVNEEIFWGENNKNASVPLHYICDMVFEGVLANGTEKELAAVLLQHDADLESISSTGRDTPLIAAASLKVPEVGVLLIDHGADIHFCGTHGATALHWACWVGCVPIVERLLQHPHDLEQTCREFQATPLYWAAHGYLNSNRSKKTGQFEAARMLIDSGSEINTANSDDLPILNLFEDKSDPFFLWLADEAAAQN